MSFHTAVAGSQSTAGTGPAAGPPSRATLSALFDSLSPGQSFVLAGPAEPGWLLSTLQADRRGLFEWAPLETGPALWRVEVFRRAAEPGELRAVAEALSWDHDRLDRLERAAFEARKAGDPERARNAYAWFALGLQRHIAFEERLLFPLFEVRAGFDPSQGPTAVMRREHGEIRQLLDRIAEGIADPGASLLDLRGAFHAVLEEHNVKEEEILYPALDSLLTAEEGDRLVADIQAFTT